MPPFSSKNIIENEKIDIQGILKTVVRYNILCLSFFICFAKTTNNDINSIISDGTHVLAGTFDKGVFLTTDNGASWTQVNNGLTDSLIIALAFFTRKTKRTCITHVPNVSEFPLYFFVGLKRLINPLNVEDVRVPVSSNLNPLFIQMP